MPRKYFNFLSAIKIADKKHFGLQTLRVIKTKQFSGPRMGGNQKPLCIKTTGFYPNNFPSGD